MERNGLNTAADVAIKLFRDVGFPALVAAFVLWRLAGDVREVVHQQQATNAALARLGDRVCVMRGHSTGDGDVQIRCIETKAIGVVRAAVGEPAGVIMSVDPGSGQGSNR